MPGDQRGVEGLDGKMKVSHALPPVEQRIAAHPGLDWPEVDPELLRLFTPVMVEIVRALGFARAREFLSRHGGRDVCIPRFHSDALGLSDDELQRLRITLAHLMDREDRIYLVKDDRLFQIVRNAQIRAESGTTSINAQAREHNLSSRQILNIRRKDDGRQLDLFLLG